MRRVLMALALHPGCSEHTPGKQEDFGHILAMQMNMVGGITKTYHYFDLCSGSGSEDGFDGSPLIVLRKAARRGLSLRAWFFDARVRKCKALEKRIADFRGSHPDFDVETHVIPGDCEHTVPEMLRAFGGERRRFFGLIYSDPYGIPPFEVLRVFTRLPCFFRTDILTYLSATAHKRAFFSPIHDEDRRIDDHLRTLGKRFIMVREPRSEHQWSFALGTNAANFPEVKDRGFYNINSPRGRHILTVLRHKNLELEALGFVRERPATQGRLFQ
jgi:three-Cys-motif partner protein